MVATDVCWAVTLYFSNSRTGQPGKLRLFLSRGLLACIQVTSPQTRAVWAANRLVSRGGGRAAGVASARSTSPWLPWQEADLGFPRSLRFPICLCAASALGRSQGRPPSPFLLGGPGTHPSRQASRPRPSLGRAGTGHWRGPWPGLSASGPWVCVLTALGREQEPSLSGVPPLAEAPGRTGFPPTASAWS